MRVYEAFHRILAHRDLSAARNLPFFEKNLYKILFFCKKALFKPKKIMYNM